jgi:hypothetical protein
MRFARIFLLTCCATTASGSFLFKRPKPDTCKKVTVNPNNYWQTKRTDPPCDVELNLPKHKSTKSTLFGGIPQFYGSIFGKKELKVKCLQGEVKGISGVHVSRQIKSMNGAYAGCTIWGNTKPIMKTVADDNLEKTTYYNISYDQHSKPSSKVAVTYYYDLHFIMAKCEADRDRCKAALLSENRDHSTAPARACRKVEEIQAQGRLKEGITQSAVKGQNPKDETAKFFYACLMRGSYSSKRPNLTEAQAETTFSEGHSQQVTKDLSRQGTEEEQSQQNDAEEVSTEDTEEHLQQDADAKLIAQDQIYNTLEHLQKIHPNI